MWIRVKTAITKAGIQTFVCVGIEVDEGRKG